MTDEPPEPGESDMRRRAAWLLGLLAVVAALLATLMVVFLGSSSGKHGTVANIDPPESTPAPTTAASSPSPSGRSASTTPGTVATSPTTVSPPTGSSTIVAVQPGAATCPSRAKCSLTGDVGNAIPAINAYRAAHGQPVVTGTVSPRAQKCALTDGDTCTGGYAETSFAKLDGTAAVAKIADRADLLDPKIKSVEVGWAYDPGAKTYYLAVVRNE